MLQGGQADGIIWSRQMKLNSAVFWNDVQFRWMLTNYPPQPLATLINKPLCQCFPNELIRFSSKPKNTRFPLARNE